MEPRGRERHRWANRKVEVSGSSRVNAGSERVSIGTGTLADEPHRCSSGFGCRNACGVVDRIGIINYHDVRDGGKLGSSRRGDLVKPVLSGSKELVAETTFLFKSRSDFAAS